MSFQLPEEGQPAQRFLRYNTTSKEKGGRKHLVTRMGSGIPIVGRSAYALDRLTPEERKLFEGPDATPWKVTLWVLDHEMSKKFRPVTYFVRNRAPDKAVVVAELFWRNVEKFGKGMGKQKYPDALGRGHATCMDEGDWKEYFEAAQSFGKKKNLHLFCQGPAAHPLMFTVPGIVFDVEQEQQPSEEDWLRAHTVTMR